MIVNDTDEVYEMQSRESANNSSAISYRIIVVPGNPGLCAYYKEFASVLFFALLSRLNSDLTVTVLSHKGHWTKAEPRWYSYEDQVEFKKHQLLSLVPAGTRVILIGHSIGCHICLKLMDDPRIQGHCRIDQAVLLFPTIERMALTPRGLWVARFTGWLFQRLAMILMWLVTLLPVAVRRRLLVHFFRFAERRRGSSGAVHDCILEGTVKLLTPTALPQVLKMANHELAEVNDLDVGLVRRCLDRIVVCYGSCDGWCPRSYYWDMCDRFPAAKGSRLRLFEESYPHAFVLGASTPVAEYCSSIITDLWPVQS